MFSSMTYPEKSAWASIAFLLIAGAQWFGATASGLMSGHALQVPDGTLVVTAALTVAVFVIIHIILAVTDLRSAASGGDERDRNAAYKAGHRASFVLQTGAAIGVLSFLSNQNGVALFHIIVATLFIALLLDSALRVASYRNMA